MKEYSDESLMIKVSKGDLEAMKFLFKRHHVPIFNFLYHMCGDKLISEDITQDVFYKILKYKGSYNGSKFTSWLYTIARNSLSEYYKKKRIVFTEITFSNDGLNHSTSNDQEDVNELYHHLNKLEMEERELIILNKIQGVRYQELAQILDISVSNAKVKVHRVIKKLKHFYFKE